MKRHLSVAILALILSACGPGEPPTVLLGIDGGEWQVIDEMIAAGELPNFARVRREGAWGHLINPGKTTSPAVWTTFATGHFPRRHGILDHVYPYSGDGARRPVTSELRQVPALWNVATHYGLRSIVIGYFVSHPPERIDGIVVSSQAPTGANGSVYPEDALKLHNWRYRELRQSNGRERIWAPFFGWEYDPAQADDPDSPYRLAAATVLERHLDRRVVRDEFIRRAVRDLVDEPSDLFIAYYRIPDFMSHSLWKYYDPSVFEDKPDEQMMHLLGNAVRESYRFVDRALGDLLDAWGGEANILVVSDHGFGRAAAHKMNDPDAAVEYLSGDHRPNGILLATGPDIQPGQIEGLTTMEIAPTLAALLGVPVAGDLPGEVALDLLRPDYVANRPLQTVADYSHVTMPNREFVLDSEVQQAEMEALKGLGYVGEGVDFDAAAVGDDYDFWAAEEALIAGHIAGEIIYHLAQGNEGLAGESFALLLEHRPEAAPRALNMTRHHVDRLVERLPQGALDPGPFERFFTEHVR